MCDKGVGVFRPRGRTGPGRRYPTAHGEARGTPFPCDGPFSGLMSCGDRNGRPNNEPTSYPLPGPDSTRVGRTADSPTYFPEAAHLGTLAHGVIVLPPDFPRTHAAERPPRRWPPSPRPVNPAFPFDASTPEVQMTRSRLALTATAGAAGLALLTTVCGGGGSASSGTAKAQDPHEPGGRAVPAGRPGRAAAAGRDTAADVRRRGRPAAAVRAGHRLELLPGRRRPGPDHRGRRRREPGHLRRDARARPARDDRHDVRARAAAGPRRGVQPGPRVGPARREPGTAAHLPRARAVPVRQRGPRTGVDPGGLSPVRGHARTRRRTGRRAAARPPGPSRT